MQYHVNTSGGAVAVGAVWVCSGGCQYHFNIFGGAIAVVAVWVCYIGCSSM